MKNLLIIAVLVVVATATAFTSDTKGLAKVERIQGIEVYLLSEPIQDYKVIETLNVELPNLTGSKSIQTQIEKAITIGLKQVDKGKMKSFDAVYSKNGERLEYIKIEK